jgi:hypothetical protein
MASLSRFFFFPYISALLSKSKQLIQPFDGLLLAIWLEMYEVTTKPATIIDCMSIKPNLREPLCTPSWQPRTLSLTDFKH